MLNDCPVRLLYAAESLGYMLAGWTWWRVWVDPSRPRVTLAAACPAAGYGLKFARISLAIVMLSR
jgi:hypothetical protein